MFHSLDSFLKEKGILILDGAMGTELQLAGLTAPAPLWSTPALIHAPHVVRGIHREYLEAGADIITTNTFRTNVRALRGAGIESRWEELNLLAVQLAFEARDWYPIDRPVLIAGSIAPVEDCYSPLLVPPDNALAEEHGRQAALLAGAGVDFLLLETMNCIREAAAACRAAAETEKPFCVSFVCGNDGALLSGELLGTAVHAVEDFSPSAILVNCVSARHILRPLEILRGNTLLPVGVYANVGTPSPAEGWEFSKDATMEEFIAHVPEWIRAGARIVGGCCGTTAVHVAGMRKKVKEEAKTRTPKP